MDSLCSLVSAKSRAQCYKRQLCAGTSNGVRQRGYRSTLIYVLGPKTTSRNRFSKCMERNGFVANSQANFPNTHGHHDCRATSIVLIRNYLGSVGGCALDSAWLHAEGS